MSKYVFVFECARMYVSLYVRACAGSRACIVHPSICLSICLSVCLYVCLSVWHSDCVCYKLPISCLPTILPTRLCGYTFLVYLPIYLSVYLPVPGSITTTNKRRHFDGPPAKTKVKPSSKSSTSISRHRVQ